VPWRKSNRFPQSATIDARAPGRGGVRLWCIACTTLVRGAGRGAPKYAPVTYK